MHVLFLDDNDKRVQLAMQTFEGDDLIIARNAYDAMRFLRDCLIGWDLVMLDHDLGGESNGWGAGQEPTGMDVVNYIVEHKPNIQRVVVHSWNPVATWMVDKLWRAGYKAEWKRFAIMQ